MDFNISKIILGLRNPLLFLKPEAENQNNNINQGFNSNLVVPQPQQNTQNLPVQGQIYQGEGQQVQVQQEQNPQIQQSQTQQPSQQHNNTQQETVLQGQTQQSHLIQSQIQQNQSQQQQTQNLLNQEINPTIINQNQQNNQVLQGMNALQKPQNQENETNQIKNLNDVFKEMPSETIQTTNKQNQTQQTQQNFSNNKQLQQQTQMQQTVQNLQKVVQQNQEPIQAINQNTKQVLPQQTQQPAQTTNQNTKQILPQQTQQPAQTTNQNTKQVLPQQTQQSIQKPVFQQTQTQNQQPQIQENNKQSIQNTVRNLNNEISQIIHNETKETPKPVIQEQQADKSNTAQNNKPQNSPKEQPNMEQIKETVSQINNIGQSDRASFIKNILGLPQTFGAMLQAAQNINKPLAGGTLGLATNINQDILQNQKVLSMLFDDSVPAAPINPEIMNMVLTQPQPQNIEKDAIALIFSGMISMPDVSKAILMHSKQAVAALLAALTTANKNGLNGKQIQDTLNVINSCISMAESENPTQTLKSLMLLYLPWLPLNAGVDFDLEITPPDGENDSNASKLTVLIQTINFGNLKGTFTLTTSNSVDAYIICSDNFPKSILQKRMAEESNAHAMNTNIDIENLKPLNENLNENRETKVNLSATNEMNPYLLLMAHSFIRNTIIIDNESVLSMV